MKRHPNRPRRMFAPCGPHELDDNGGMMVSTKPELGRRVPVLVIPLTQETVDTLRYKMAMAFSGSYDGHLHKDDLTAMLQTIGIKTSRKTPSL